MTPLAPSRASSGSLPARCRVLLALVCLAFVTGGLRAAPGSANDCAGPPWNPWPSGLPENICSVSGLPCTTDADCPSLPFFGSQSCIFAGTLDLFYLPEACGSFPEAWASLHLHTGDWSHGHGLVSTSDGIWTSCAFNDDLTRLLTAWRVVEIVTEHAAPFGLHGAVLDPDGDLGPLDVDGQDRLLGLWSVFVGSHEPDEWTPGCGNGGVLATNYSGGIDEYIELHKSSMYRSTAVNRSSTLVHETVHEDVGHEGDDTCTAGGSCDTRFGRYNAQTMQIRYLYDAATTYQLQDLGGQLVRVGAPFDDPASAVRRCRLVPRFTEYERNAALTTANRKYDRNFRWGPLLPLSPRMNDADAADAATRSEWDCDSCDPSEWTFDPDTCGGSACNEFANPGNAAVNQANQAACLAYNQAVEAGGFSVEAIDQAKEDHPLLGCLGPDEDALRAYCDARKAVASSLADLDPCGVMENGYGPMSIAEACREEFCHERFEADGGVGWSEAGDPYGCLAHFCPPDAETCGGAPPQAACRQLYLAAHGHPDFVLGACPAAGCNRVRALCLIDALSGDPEAWEYPDPLPPPCDLFYQGCRLAETFQAMAFLSAPEIAGVAIPDTGPVEHAINPGIWVPQQVLGFQTMMLSGTPDEELASLFDSLVGRPEAIRRLFELAPGRFVAMFGPSGFDEWIGPEIRSVQPEPLLPEELPERGRAALERLEELIASGAPEFRMGPLGVPLSQREQIDGDGDSVPDWRDNCRDVPNRDQADADAGVDDDSSLPGVQHYGDACDADLDNDGVVAVTDFFGVFRACLGERTPLSRRCAPADLNGDGSVDPVDFFSRFRPALGSRPGPGVTE